MRRSVASFKTWLTANGVTLNETLVEFRVVDGGWSIFAREDVAAGTPLGWIPSSAILSAKNTQIAHLLEEQELTGGLALVIAAVYEKSQGAQSNWRGYFQSMPERVPLPIFWSDSELEPLNGTAIVNRVQQDRQFMREDYDTHVPPLMKHSPEAFQNGDITFEDFKWAASIVSSRAFYVDRHHGQSLVPFADVFNHKCAIVAMDQEHQLVEAASDESSDEDEQNRIAREDLPSELRLEISICSSSVDGEEGLEIKAAQALSKGQEIHNTYGELSNEALLHKYGFCVEANPFDEVSLNANLLLEEIQRQLPTDTYTTRLNLLQELDVEEGVWDFKILPEDQITQSAIAVLECFFGDENEDLSVLLETRTSEWLSQTIALQDASISPSALNCLRTALKRQLHSLEPLSSHRVEAVRVWSDGGCVLLNKFIKYVDVHISESQDLQHSTFMKARWMTESKEKRKESQYPEALSLRKKRKFLQSWCIVDD